MAEFSSKNETSLSSVNKKFYAIAKLLWDQVIPQWQKQTENPRSEGSKPTDSPSYSEEGPSPDHQ